MQSKFVKCTLSDLAAVPVFVLSQTKVYANFRVEYVRVNEKLECISRETESALESVSQARFRELAPGEFYLVLLKYPADKDGNRWIAWQQDLEDHFKAEPDTYTQTEDGPVSNYLLEAKEKLRKKFGLKPVLETVRITKIDSGKDKTSEDEEDSLNVKPAPKAPEREEYTYHQCNQQEVVLPPIPMVDLNCQRPVTYPASYKQSQQAAQSNPT